MRITNTGNVGIGTTGPVSKLTIGVAPTATGNYATLSIGGGSFTGGGAPAFTGSSSGTSIGVNEVSGYAGNLLDVQMAGMSKFSVSAGGAGVFASSVTVAGAAPTVSPSQVGIGGTTAAVSNCGSLATACLVINVAGTTRYIPYF